jgi:hypothetical protein
MSAAMHRCAEESLETRSRIGLHIALGAEVRSTVRCGPKRYPARRATPARDKMTAAIYARKSTEQIGLAEEQRSVARQIEHAKATPRARAGRSTRGAFSSTTGSAGRSSRIGRALCG